MMTSSATACAHLCLLVSFLTQAGAAELDYFWPLPLERALSSTFGETRPPGNSPPAAFHAGIDLKTWGKTGYEVRALADGYVMRVRTSPWGYGRALYQRLSDGRIAVYAHLQAFAEPLATHVEQAQQQSQRYTTDLWLEEGEITIDRGQVIAWSGKSGAGPPHLHLELRNSDNVPVNPLSHGFQVRDTTPPTIRSIAFVPLGPQSTVGGNHNPVTLDLRWDGERQFYRSASTPIVFGRIGIAFRGHDRADLADNRLAPYRTDLRVDGAFILSSTYEQFAYGDAFQANMDRLRLGPKGTYAALFRRPGNRLSFYRSKQTGPSIGGSIGVLFCGIQDESPTPTSAAILHKGRHTVEVVSFDAAGNSRTARVGFVVNAPPRIVSSRMVREKEGDFLEAELSDSDDDLLTVTLALADAGDNWKGYSTQTLSADSGPFTWPLPKSGRMVRLSVEDSTGARAFRTHATGETASKRLRRAESESDLVIEQTHFRNFVELRIASDQSMTGPPALLWHPFDAATGELRQTGPTEYRAVIRFKTPVNEFTPSGPLLGSATPTPVEADELSIAIEAKGADTGARILRTTVLSATPVDAASAAVVSFHGGATRLSFPRGSVYETVYPQSEQIRVPAPAVDTGVPAAFHAAYRFGPPGVTFNHKVSIAIRLPDEIEDAEKMAVYVDHSGDGEWAFAGREFEPEKEERYMSARVRSFGRQYALRADRRPPEISQMQPADGARVSATGLKLSASIKDEDSGIGLEEDIVMLLDGQRLISVYDPDADLVEFSSNEPQRYGVHELVVKVTDRCGNEATGTSRFTVE